MFTETTVFINFVASSLVLLKQVWFNLALGIRRQYISMICFQKGVLAAIGSSPNLTHQCKGLTLIWRLFSYFGILHSQPKGYEYVFDRLRAISRIWREWERWKATTSTSSGQGHGSKFEMTQDLLTTADNVLAFSLAAFFAWSYWGRIRHQRLSFMRWWTSRG